MKRKISIGLFSLLFLLLAVNSQGTECEGSFQADVPNYARVPHYKFPSPPSSYHSALAWTNAMLGDNSFGTNGSVTVRKLELWEVDGRYRRIIAQKLLCNSCTDPKDKPFGYLWPIDQWTQSTSWSKENEGYKFIITPENYVEAPVYQHPDMVYHFWQANWPRPKTNSNATYVARAEVFVTGNAMVNIGFDHYELPSSGTNKEGASSKWVCAEPDWQEVVAGDFGNSIPIGQNTFAPLSPVLLLKK